MLWIGSFSIKKNKIKKPAERECCCVNLNQKRGAILPVIMCILSRWHHASADPLISLLCFVSLCTQCNYHLRVGFLLCLNENYTRHKIRLCLLTRSSLVSLSFLIIFKTKTRINIWNEFKFTCLYCRHCCCCQLGDLDREKGLNKIWERESLRHVCTLGELVRN